MTFHSGAELSSTSSLPPFGSNAHTGIRAAGAGSVLRKERADAASVALASGAPTEPRRWSMTSTKLKAGSAGTRLARRM